MPTHFPTVPVAAAPKEGADTTAEHLPPLVLIVDDEPLIAETLAAILKGVGMAAITAPDAQAALEIARVIPPQMLITDVAMPRVNGFELAVAVRRIAPDCEVILFSGQPSTYDLTTEYNNQGYDFVTLIKPVHPTDLLAHVFDRLGKPGAPISVWNAPEGPDTSEELLGGSAPVGGKPRAHRARKPRADQAERNDTGPAKFRIN